MNIQRVLLRVMLASLAVAAAVGALAALTNQTETFWRIIGTCVITSVAAGLLIPLSRHLDKDRSRPAALTGVAAIVVEFIFVLMQIWEIVNAHHVEPVVTALLFVPVAVAAAILVYMAGTCSTKWAGICGLVLDAAVFFTAMLATWGGPWAVSDKYAGIASVIAIFGAMIVACLIGSGSRDRRWWRWIGVAAAAGAMAMNAYGIWHDLRDPNAFSVVIDTVPALLAFANLMMLADLRPNQVWVRYLAIITATITAACEDIAFIQNLTRHINSDDIMARIAAAGGIITGCAAVGVAILVALNRTSKPKPIATDAIHGITVICPLCQKKNVLAIDTPVQCACGLKMTIAIEEPHCAECGYLLIGLTSDRCPECGTAINAAAQVPNP